MSRSVPQQTWECDGGTPAPWLNQDPVEASRTCALTCISPSNDCWSQLGVAPGRRFVLAASVCFGSVFAFLRRTALAELFRSNANQSRVVAWPSCLVLASDAMYLRYHQSAVSAASWQPLPKKPPSASTISELWLT